MSKIKEIKSEFLSNGGSLFFLQAPFNPFSCDNKRFSRGDGNASFSLIYSLETFLDFSSFFLFLFLLFFFLFPFCIFFIFHAKRSLFEVEKSLYRICFGGNQSKRSRNGARRPGRARRRAIGWTKRAVELLFLAMGGRHGN